MHPNQAAFKEGVTYLFHSWTALKLAVDGEWGGHDTAAKRDWFVDTIVDYFGQHGKNVDNFELEDILVQIMNDEFSILLEDKSEEHISKALEQLYLNCTRGNYELVESLKQDAVKISGALNAGGSKKMKQSKAEGEEDDDSSDDDDEDEEAGEDGDDVEMGEASAPRAPKEKQEPIIDEDGFETVVRKGRRR